MAQDVYIPYPVERIVEVEVDRGPVEHTYREIPVPETELAQYTFKRVDSISEERLYFLGLVNGQKSQSRYLVDALKRLNPDLDTEAAVRKIQEESDKRIAQAESVLDGVINNKRKGA